MRTFAIVTILVAVLAVCVLGAERRKLADVSLERFVTETQKSLDSPNGFNLVWIIPSEYWEASFAQEPSIPASQREEMIDALDDYLMVGVVRADLSPLGAFRFHGESRVRGSLTITAIDAEGKATFLSAPEQVSADAALVLQMIKPMLSAALGNMGSNFHIFLYKTKDAEGERIASPWEKGKLRVKLAKLGTDVSGTLEWQFPLDCLFVPRVCAPCEKEMHISWHFCPWCGEKLPQ